MDNEELVIKTLLEHAQDDAYMKMIEMDILELKAGYCYARIKNSSKIRNPYNSVHGGCLFTLADISSGYAACAYGKFVSTISGTMNYIRPAMDTKYVYCKAQVVRNGKTVSLCNVELFDDNNKLLENGTFNFYTLHKKVIED